MNDNSSKKKDKEEITPFTRASEIRILAYLLYDKEATEDIQNVRPEDFEFIVVKNMLKLICDFYEKYSRLPTLDEFDQMCTRSD